MGGKLEQVGVALGLIPEDQSHLETGTSTSKPPAGAVLKFRLDTIGDGADEERPRPAVFRLLRGLVGDTFLVDSYGLVATYEPPPPEEVVDKKQQKKNKKNPQETPKRKLLAEDATIAVSLNALEARLSRRAKDRDSLAYKFDLQGLHFYAHALSEVYGKDNNLDAVAVSFSGADGTTWHELPPDYYDLLGLDAAPQPPSE